MPACRNRSMVPAAALCARALSALVAYRRGPGRRSAPAARVTVAARFAVAAALFTSVAPDVLLAAGADHGPARALGEDHATAPAPTTAEPSLFEAGVPRPSGTATTYTYRITTGNNLGLTLYNDGFFGNNFSSRTEPSFEYPLGSNIEHMPRAGIWVGAKRYTAAGDSAFLVTTATRSARIGSRAFDSEFTPATGIQERSILPNSRYFSPDARSEQDFLTAYTDTVALPDPEEEHRPLDIQVELETLLFSFEPFDAIVIANFKVINLHPTDPLFDVYLGFYTELASGFKDAADPNWTRGWFEQKDIAWVDSLRMVSEHHYNEDGGLAPAWAGVQLLGTRPIAVSDLTVSFNWWNWYDEINRVGDAPTDDQKRYDLMANGQIDATGGSEAPNTDPVQMISVGPFPVFEAGDTLEISFAFVGGEYDTRNNRTAEEDLAFNAAWAQTAFDLNFNIPVPPPSPDLRIVPQHERISLLWKDDPERFLDPKTRQMDFEGYRIYTGETRQESDLRRIVEVDLVDSVFYNTGLELVREETIVEGDTFAYRYDIDGVRDGFKYWVSVTSFDSGTPEIESLESGRAQNLSFVVPGSPAREVGSKGKVRVFPNPYRGDAVWDGQIQRDRYLWFANLPPRCTIRIYTLAGDLVDVIDFDAGSYDATDIRGIYDPTDTRNPESDIPVLSGGMAAWDMISRNDQGIASGLYIYSVEDHRTGDHELGKFLILK